MRGGSSRDAGGPVASGPWLVVGGKWSVIRLGIPAERRYTRLESVDPGVYARIPTAFH